MKIALAQLNLHIGNFDANYRATKNAIAEAQKNHADLIIFPELSICGYPPLDLLTYSSFIAQCETQIEHITQLADDIGVIIGTPSPNSSPHQKSLHNSAHLLHNQQIKATVHKSLLPTYDVFDEARYFAPNKQFELIEFKGVKLGLTICEDIWNRDSFAIYQTQPIEEIKKLDPNLVINISASPFNYQQPETRQNILTKAAQAFQSPLIYVNQVGAHTDLLFDGHSQVYNQEGQIVKELPYFEEKIDYYELSSPSRSKTTSSPTSTALIHDGLVMGIRDYFHKSGFKKGIIGLSGGIDSSVSTVLAKRALGKENLKVLLLPSEYSSKSSITDGEQLCQNLDISYETVPIRSLINQYFDLLHPYFQDSTFDRTEENIQARARMVILMAFANKFNHILINTSNKSEIAVGFGTLYGDLSGALSVLGDVYKTQVYQLASYINQSKKIIPQNVIEKPPSAELRPDQKDTDVLPPYPKLDKILYHYIEMKKGTEELVKMGFEKKLINNIRQRVDGSEHKRFQLGPVLRVSPKAFGLDRRIPLVAQFDF